ncbi:MAG: hypothetical protein ABI867_01920 [Kofleriaceae bacterium]
MGLAGIACACIAVIGCGSASTTTPPSTTAPPPVHQPTEAERAATEHARRDVLAAEQRVRLDEQATAFAATCDKPVGSVKRCLPSCYEAEPADPRAGRKPVRSMELVHLVCAHDPATGPFVLADELGGAAMVATPIRGGIPKPAKRNAAVEAAVTTALKPELARTDAIRLTGAWKPVEHPVTHERMQCAAVSHFATALTKPLDPCGSRGATTCEAAGNAAAHGINVIHYRLAEARRLQVAGKLTECRQAALEAIAVAHGMPRWRQYMQLNTTKWRPAARYRTRYDGVLDEDAVFATAVELDTEARTVFAACGGASPTTTAADEQSFHTCW